MKHVPGCNLSIVLTVLLIFFSSLVFAQLPPLSVGFIDTVAGSGALGLLAMVEPHWRLT
jgi:hypothetical protein